MIQKCIINLFITVSRRTINNLLRISSVPGNTGLDTTVRIFQPAPGNTELSIYVDDKKLKVVERYTSLGSTIKRFGSLDDAWKIIEAMDAFSVLFRPFVVAEGIEKVSSLKCINSYVLTCETWVVYI